MDEQRLPTIEAIDPTGEVRGWRYLWLKYVRGFSPGTHCATCLVGSYSKHVKRNGMRVGVPMPLDESPFYQHIYLCGVASAGGWAANLHLATVPAAGEVAEVQASTGTLFRITNARRLDIPGLEPGYQGRPRSFTTCRNWQFGVEYYGQNAKLRAFGRNGRPFGLQATAVQTPE